VGLFGMLSLSHGKFRPSIPGTHSVSLEIVQTGHVVAAANLAKRFLPGGAGSDEYPLNLVRRHFLGAPIVKLRGARRGVVGYCGDLLQRADRPLARTHAPDAANSAERTLTAVMAVPNPAVCEEIEEIPGRGKPYG
jgi:hypothetical protein